MTNFNDLSGLDMEGWKLQDCDLRHVNMEGACLVDAHMYRADLRWANIRNCDFTGANLEGANLGGADARGAYFEGAHTDGIMAGRTTSPALPKALAWLVCQSTDPLVAGHMLVDDRSKFKDGSEHTVENFCRDVRSLDGEGFTLMGEKLALERARRGRKRIIGCFCRREEAVIPWASSGEWRVPWISVIGGVRHG